MTKKSLVALCALVSAFAIGTANADSINFAQFGPDYTSLGNTINGTTYGGVSVTLVGPGSGFQLYTQGTSWYGTFANGAPVLWDYYATGPVTLTFGTGVSSFTLSAQSNDYGAFTETMLAYSGATLVDTVSANWTSADNPGTNPFLTVTGTDITSLVVSTTNDGDGFGMTGAVPTGAVPEPPSLALFGLGLALLTGFGVTRRRRRS